ncbi:MAG: hypothetical protein WC386_02035 [Candidatus Paceibacterota bacterium]|jgi:hypothetical protein
MTDEIIKKLNKVLNQEYLTECEVVYVLVQVGKILEREETKKEYNLINFYRNWVCHSFLDRNEASQIIKEIKKILNEDCSGNQFEKAKTINTKEKIYPIISFKKFQDQMRNFFNSHGIIFNGNWKKFIYKLISIISNIPLQEKEEKYSFCLVKINNDEFIICIDWIEGSESMSFCDVPRNI